MADREYQWGDPLHPDDERLGLDGRPFSATGPGIYTIGSNVYRASKDETGDYRGTMRERCTNCGGSRKGIGVALYSHPWCMACLRSFNEDGTLKAEKVERWHDERRDLDNRVNPETFVLSKAPHQPLTVVPSQHRSTLLSTVKAFFSNSTRKKKQT